MLTGQAGSWQPWGSIKTRKVWRKFDLLLSKIKATAPPIFNLDGSRGGFL